uniref:CRAL-TRIO domain-containing protein n=1 Tax=Photinus pyralis TaxID=7054 RepID=A0A1Y1LTY1_PHOPY
MPMELESSIHKTFSDSFKKHTLNPAFLQVAEDELNETPENYKQQLNLLRLLVANDKNLRLPEDDAFLIRFLRAKKFDGHKAFHMLQRYYLMKIKYPELITCPLPSEVSRILNFQAQNMLVNRDQFGRRVYIIRVDNFDSTQMTIEEVFRTNILALEEVVREPETQIAGVVVIVDMAGLKLHHAKFFTPHYAKRTVEVVQDTFPLRFKGFHIVNEPFYFDAFMAVVKPFLKDKVRKRIQLHGTNFSSLHEFIHPDILPFEYGGTAGTFDNRPWHLQLLSHENYFKTLENYGYKVDNNDD